MEKYTISVHVPIHLIDKYPQECLLDEWIKEQSMKWLPKCYCLSSEATQEYVMVSFAQIFDFRSINKLWKHI